MYPTNRPTCVGWWKPTGKFATAGVVESFLIVFLLSNYSQKSRASQQGLPTPAITVQAKGPDEDKIKAILERTGYTLDVTTGNYPGHHPAFFRSSNTSLFPNDNRTTKVRRSASELGRWHPGQRVRGVLRQNTQRHVRRWADTAVRKVRQNLGPPPDDGPDDRHESRLRVRHLHLTGCRLQCSAGGKSTRLERPHCVRSCKMLDESLFP